MGVDTVAAYEEKLQALEQFSQRLLTSPSGSQVAKIVLFGSVSKNEARPESDIDVLVFAFDGSEALRDACAQAAFEVAMETGEGIEPLVYPIRQYYDPNTYFIYRASRYGREVYSVDEQELKRRESESLQELADVVEERVDRLEAILGQFMV